MRIVFAALWTCAVLLYCVRGQPSLRVNSSIIVKQTTYWEYFAVPRTEDPDPFTLIELLVDPPQTPLALLAHRHKGPPLYLPSSHYLIADEADYEGWFSPKSQHSLVLYPSTMKEGTTVGVFVNESEWGLGEVRYQLRMRSASQNECPFGCSGNGRCREDGTCDCFPYFTASDCSLPSHKLSTVVQHTRLFPASWTYFTVNLTTRTSYAVSPQYSLWLNWTEGDLEVLTKDEFDHLSMLPSEVEYTKRYISSSPLFVDFPSDVLQTWRLAIRPVLNLTGVSLSLQLVHIPDETSFRIVWGLVATAGVAVAMMLVFGGYKLWRCRKRRLAFAYATQRSTLSGMPASLVDIHFPVHLFEELHSESESQTCSICLGKFEAGALVRELACQHRFHSACIAAWFRSSTVAGM